MARSLMSDSAALMRLEQNLNRDQPPIYADTVSEVYRNPPPPPPREDVVPRGNIYSATDRLRTSLFNPMTGLPDMDTAMYRINAHMEGDPVSKRGPGMGAPLPPTVNEYLEASLDSVTPLPLAALKVKPSSKYIGTSPGNIRAAARKQGRQMTVQSPTALAFPGIYDEAEELVGRAKVAPEDPALKRLFGVNREDLFEISEQGSRKGNIIETPYRTAAKPKGAAHASRIMIPQNAERIGNILKEAKKRPDLYKGMASWYTTDPLYDQFKRLWGDDAAEEFKRFNVFTGMSSPGSPVLDELARGTAANWLAGQGRFDDFVKYGGMRPGVTPPADMAKVPGHVYHKTAQAGPMQKYVDTGEVKMGSAKVPSYITGSGVPETGFQTQYPVGDAHWARVMGLPDVRNPSRAGGVLKPATASASVPEMVSLTPWFRDEIATPAGLEPVPAQGIIWGAGSNATGVDSPIGAPKLELLAMQIMKASKRLGISPEEARDMVIRRQTYAGKALPGYLGGLGAATGLGALTLPHFMGEEE